MQWRKIQMIELFGISGFKLVAFLVIMIPFTLLAIAGLYLIVLCCVRDVREVKEYYKKKYGENEAAFNLLRREAIVMQIYFAFNSSA